MSSTIQGFFTDLNGNPVQPAITGDAGEDDAFKYQAALITYDIPASHIKGIPQSADSPDVLSADNLKSMRNAINHWLRKNAVKVSDSEYMVPVGNKEQYERVVTEWTEKFKEPFTALYEKWGLYSQMSLYRIVVSAHGAMTKTAQALKAIYEKIQSLNERVTRYMRWHESSESKTVFAENQLIYGDKEKQRKLDAQSVRRYITSYESFDEVMSYFLNDEAAKECGLGSVRVVRKDMDNIAKVISKMAAVTGVEF